MNSQLEQTPLETGLGTFLCIVTAYLFHEKMMHAKTVQRYRGKMSELNQNGNNVDSEKTQQDTGR